MALANEGNGTENLGNGSDRIFEAMVARWPETFVGGVHALDLDVLPARLFPLYLLRVD